MSVEQHLDALAEVSEAASKEHAIEKALAQMKAEWSGIEVAVKPWRDTGSYILLGDSVDEIQTLLDDHIVKTQTARQSPFAKPFLDDIKEWEAWLTHTQEIVEVWLKVQAAWVYLEPVFGAEDITKQVRPTTPHHTTPRRCDCSWWARERACKCAAAHARIIQSLQSAHCFSSFLFFLLFFSFSPFFARCPRRAPCSKWSTPTGTS